MNDGSRRPEACITDLVFDAWFAGAIREEDRVEAEAHLAGCARCQGRRAELFRLREEFLALRPQFEIPSERGGRAGAPVRENEASAGKRRGAPWALAIAATVALGGVLFARALLRPATDPGDAPGIRTKGGMDVGFDVEREGRGARGAFGQVVHPGDRIRFLVRSPRAVHLAIFGLDLAGTATVYFPHGSAARRIEGGAEAPVDTVVELDETPGHERLLIVSCDRSFPVEPLRKELEVRRELRPPEGCEVREEGWVKAPR